MAVIMTNEEAISRIKTIKLKIEPPTNTQLGWLETWIHKEDEEAFDMAIKALDQEPIILKVNEKQLEKLIHDNPLCVAMAEPKTDVLDKIRAEIDQYLFRNEFGSEYRKEVSQIIDKYRQEG